ncbi:MAG: hypothetical protein IT198_01365 [Acidimicrobiia bacterium]|nr:hypothetical protein [Acidimicrobiia bacterium]
MPAPGDIFQRAHPWRTSTSDAWLRNGPDSPIVVVSGESGTSLPCLAEGPDVEPCVLDAGGSEGFLDLLDAYEDEATPGVPTVLNISWSIGVPSPAEAAEAFFAAVEPEVTAGRATWETLPQIAAHFPRVEVDDSPPAVDPATPPPADLERNAVRAGDDRWWVRNPTSRAWLWVRTLAPAEPPEGPLRVVVMVPGGANGADKFLQPPGDGQAIADAGNLVVVFDPDGRGRSEGVEDADGYTQQDGLAAVVRLAVSLPDDDADRVGIVSYSYGVTMATGALARHPDLPPATWSTGKGPRTASTQADAPDTPDPLRRLPSHDPRSRPTARGGSRALISRVPHDLGTILCRRCESSTREDVGVPRPRAGRRARPQLSMQEDFSRHGWWRRVRRVFDDCTRRVKGCQWRRTHIVLLRSPVASQ